MGSVVGAIIGTGNEGAHWLCGFDVEFGNDDVGAGIVGAQH
mgnify:CR=1 FL=1